MVGLFSKQVEHIVLRTDSDTGEQRAYEVDFYAMDYMGFGLRLL
jgi:hypothetical protein